MWDRLKRRSDNRDGVAAVELAMIAPVFFLIIFATIELAVVFLTDSLLDHAVTQSGRDIRTGRADGRGMTAEDFKQAICSDLSILSNGCLDRLTVDVRPLPAFSQPLPEPEKPSDLVDRYDGGAPGSLMLVRVWYRHPVITPFMDQAIARVGDERAALLRATMAFKNEPFIQASPAGQP